MTDRRFQRDPSRPCFVISVAAGIVQAHPRTLRIYEDEGLLAPARTPTNIRLYSENDIRRILWIRRLTQERGVNLAGVKLIFELEERLGVRILEALFDDERAREAAAAALAPEPSGADPQDVKPETQPTGYDRRSESSGNTDTAATPEAVTSFEDDLYTGAQGRFAGQGQDQVLPVQRPVTRIVATRVVANRSGETND